MKNGGEVTLKEKINLHMKEALRSGNKIRLSTLRLLASEIRNAEIAKRKELDDEGVLEVVAKEVKRRKEAIREFEKAGREDLRDKEMEEATILEGYLPPQLSEEELRQIIAQVLETSGAKSIKEMGRVMGLVVPQTKGRADGKLVSEMVKEALTAKEKE